MSDRIQMIKDKNLYKKFVYEIGEETAAKIMQSRTTNENYLDICMEIIDACNDYPDNSYGKPRIHDIMCEVYRRINYQLSDIAAR